MGWGTLVKLNFELENEIAVADESTLVHIMSDRIRGLEKIILNQGKLQQKAERIHKQEISKMQAMMTSMSNGILALLKKDADIIETVINEINTTNEINNENKNSNDEEDNENIIEVSRNEQNIRVKINGTMQSTLLTSQSEVQLKEIQSLKYLKVPSALGYQSEKGK